MAHFTETHDALRDAVRKMVDKEIRPIAAEIDESDHIPERIISIFGDMGLMQMLVPEQYGGPGGDVTSVCTRSLVLGAAELLKGRAGARRRTGPRATVQIGET